MIKVFLPSEENLFFIACTPTMKKSFGKPTVLCYIKITRNDPSSITPKTLKSIVFCNKISETCVVFQMNWNRLWKKLDVSQIIGHMWTHGHVSWNSIEKNWCVSNHWTHVDTWTEKISEKNWSVSNHWTYVDTCSYEMK